MRSLRIGSRGSDLAIRQAQWVCSRLREAHRELTVELVPMTTSGDLDTDANFGASWPVGAFVSALERALVEQHIDVAVHSLKDLPTESMPGLTVAAVPEREVPFDVLLMREAIGLEELPDGARIGTSSPRRAAQLRHHAPVRVVPIRGNVPTRIAKLAGGSLDGIVLAAAGLARLGIGHPHAVTLPTDRFVPAPGQGALAVQTRAGSDAARLVTALDHVPTRVAVTAERAFLREVGAGCHTPAGAYATLEGDTVSLRAQLFSGDHERCAEGTERGADSTQVGVQLARRLLAALD